MIRWECRLPGLRHRPRPGLAARPAPPEVPALNRVRYSPSSRWKGLLSREQHLLVEAAQGAGRFRLERSSHGLSSTAGVRRSSDSKWLSRYLMVARDMSDELREAQRRHQDELACTPRAWVTLGELASGIAHEINQPLAAVVNYAGASQRYLQSLGSNPQAAERIAQGLARITEHANHAAQVIKRLRGFLRRPAAHAGAAARRGGARGGAPVPVGSRQPPGEHRRTFRRRPVVYADRVLLEQVLLNLLRNAMDIIFC